MADGTDLTSPSSPTLNLKYGEECLRLIKCEYSILAARPLPRAGSAAAPERYMDMFLFSKASIISTNASLLSSSLSVVCEAIEKRDYLMFVLFPMYENKYFCFLKKSTMVVTLRYTLSTLRDVLEYIVLHYKGRNNLDNNDDRHNDKTTRRVRGNTLAGWEANVLDSEAGFDAIVESFALSHDIGILMNKSNPNTNLSYNVHIQFPTIYITHTEDSLTWDENDRERLSALPYTPFISNIRRKHLTQGPMNFDPTDQNQQPLTMEASSNEDIAVGWYFDEGANDFVRLYMKPNVFKSTPSQDNAQLNDYEDGSLLFVCPSQLAVKYVEGFSARGQVTFERVTVYDKTKLNCQLVRIHGGLETCLIDKVTDIFFLSAEGTPIAHVDPHAAVCELIKNLTAENSNLDQGAKEITIVDVPFIKSFRELADHDTGQRLFNLRVGVAITDGECVYRYQTADKIDDAGTLNALVDTMPGKTYALCHRIDYAPQSPASLCMSLTNMDIYMSAIANNIPEGRSVIYKTLEGLLAFLLKIGFSGTAPYCGDPLSVHRIYKNVRTFERHLFDNNGTASINMSAFTFEAENGDCDFIHLKDWIETNSGLTYTPCTRDSERQNKIPML
ncbi:hypothetical protein ElyMa_005789100 [Elysia marginata]|uniref:Uncharacterized protein n=1 Tax=Elysia marginata TaxID=1093978 RepID=A0AAV4FTH0_9GAST|nr:hypothetical protein ElyMa_005789100 [Elysia marginata]